MFFYKLIQELIEARGHGSVLSTVILFSAKVFSLFFHLSPNFPFSIPAKTSVCICVSVCECISCVTHVLVMEAALNMLLFGCFWPFTLKFAVRLRLRAAFDRA